MDAPILPLLLVVIAAFTCGALTGFGTMVITLTLGAHLLPIPELLPIVLPLNTVLVLYLVARYRRHVAWRLVLAGILPIMGLGTIVSTQFLSGLHAPALKQAFGVLVIVVSARELYSMYRPSEQRGLTGFARNVCIFFAGIVHGIYATGGPLLVYALGRAGLSPTVFRSTLAVVWAVLNLMLVATYIAKGQLTLSTVPNILYLLPGVVIATLLGELLFSKIDAHRFRITVFCLLLVAGGALVF